MAENDNFYNSSKIYGTKWNEKQNKQVHRQLIIQSTAKKNSLLCICCFGDIHEGRQDFRGR